MSATQYDVLIVGGGQAGIPLAHALAKAGRRVALAEHKNLGGSCVNFGCTPTKAAIASARVAHLARRGAEFGLKIPSVEVDFPAVLARAREVVLESRRSLDHGFENIDNPTLLRGHARFTGPAGPGFQLDVGGLQVTATEVVLNTGARTSIPAIAGLNANAAIASENWLDHSELPERLAIIGGGYIGMEMGQFYRRMGSRVSIWHGGARVLEHEDPEVSAALQGFVEAEGIEVHLNTRIDSVRQLDATHVFLATGRVANTDDLGLESIGLELNKSFVKVDARLKTSVAGVWAAGDIRGGPQFTHTSWDDYRILVSQMTGDGSRTTDRIVPYAVFTDPELGRVGMTENEAREQPRKYTVKRFEMKSNGKAREIGEPAGFIKVLIEVETNLILGAAIVAYDAAELVHMYVDIMNARAPATAIRDAIHIHPTLAEAVQSAVS